MTTTPRTASPRVALYARVSTLHQGQDTGLQLDELRQVSAQRGWAIVAEYVDEGVSGAKVSRPQLDKMLADAQAGRFDLLAVWKLDRLGRSLQHLLQILDQLACAGVGFAAIRDSGIDTTTPTGRLLLQLLGAFAEYERSLLRERVVAGVRRAQASGKHCGRPRKDIDLRPALALLNEGRGLKDVARILKVPRATLRRRLDEAGRWPVDRAAA
jgi:DNA invertase Pin-like site-specific DNA recombinase